MPFTVGKANFGVVQVTGDDIASPTDCFVGRKHCGHIVLQLHTGD